MRAEMRMAGNVTRRKLKAAPPLWKLVVRAMEIIAEDRAIAHRSFTDALGRIPDAGDRRIVRRYDKWLKDARAEIGWGPK